jgi:DNA mismatch repair protein MutS2
MGFEAELQVEMGQGGCAIPSTTVAREEARILTLPWATSAPGCNSKVSSKHFPQSTLESLELDAVLAWMAEFTSTPGGRDLLLQAHPDMPQPAREQRRARGLEALQAVVSEHAPGFTGGGDLPAALAAADKRILECDELMAVADSLDLQRQIGQWCSQHRQYIALSESILAAPDCGSLREAVRRALGRRGEILDEAHLDLGSARRKASSLREQRGQRIEEIAGHLHKQGVLRQRHAVQRADRLLLAVKATDAGRARGVVHDRSHSGDTLFIEPGEVLELSNRLVEALSRVRRIEQEVLTQLTRSVLRRKTDLAQIAGILADLDLAFAAARWATRLEGSYAEMSGAQLSFRQARHPLLQRQMGLEQVVSLSLSLGGAYQLLVVTGPNTGGKTVVLKCVGLLAALSMCGLPISAAEGCQVPVLTGLHADIGDQQSLESSLSTFSGHLKRTLEILEHAQPGALVLLDELGTGTDPEEGAALGQAVLERLLQCEVLTIANTHLGQLKIFSTEVERAENASMEFDPQSLSPRFRLLVGVPGASHAIEVAEHLGLPLDLVQRARLLAEREGGADKLLANVGRVRRDAELLREKAQDHEARTRDAQLRIQADAEVAEYRAELRQAEAEDAFNQLRRDMTMALQVQGKSLQAQARGQQAEAWAALMAELNLQLEACNLGKRWTSFIAGLKKGDLVYVPRFRDRLKVLKIQRKREILKLRHGNLEVELPWREVTWVEPPPGGD